MSKEALLEKMSSIAEQICHSEAADVYWKAKRKMEGHERAQALFEELKLKRNTSLILQQRLEVDHPKVMLAELEVQDLETELQGIPVAIQYQAAQADLNELLQGVVQLVLGRLTEELPVELGPRQGCGKGHDGNGCTCGNN